MTPWDPSRRVDRVIDRRRFLAFLGSVGGFSSFAGCATNNDPEVESPIPDTPTPTRIENPEAEATPLIETQTATRSPTLTPTSTGTQTSSPPPQCDSESVSTEVGELPVHTVKAMPAKAKTRGISDDEGQDISAKESEANSGSIPNSYFNLVGLIDGTGTLAMNTGAAFTSYWEPPETGEYTVTGAYFGTGQYTYAPEDDKKRDYTICFESNLSVIRNCQRVVASTTQPDLRHANDGLREEVAEQLLEYLAYALVAPHLGLVGRFIAKKLIGWAIELDLREPTEGSFFIDPAEPHQTEVSFTAREGELYAIQYTPSIGFVGKSREDWILTSETEANYHLDSLSISPE